MPSWAVSQPLSSINKLCGPEPWASRLLCDGWVPERFRSSAYSADRTPGRTASHACTDERMDGWSHWGDMKRRNGDRTEGGMEEGREGGGRAGVEKQMKQRGKAKVLRRKCEIKGRVGEIKWGRDRWMDKGRDGGMEGGGTCGTQDMGERETVPGRFVFGGWGSVMADICTAHGHLGWFIYPRPPDQASDLPEFVRLEGAPYHTTQFFTFHISSHFQLPVSLYHSARPNPVQADHTQFQQSRKNRPDSGTVESWAGYKNVQSSLVWKDGW